MTHSDRIATPALLPIFRLWVVGSVLLVAISPTDIPLRYRLYLAISYSLLFFYPVFSKKYGRIASVTSINYNAISPLRSAILLLLQFFAVSICTKFYTGSSYVDSFIAALSGENTYSAYQAYFSEQFLLESLATRIGYTTLLTVAKIIFIFSIVNFFLSYRRKAYTFIFMMFSCVIYIGFGLARGTFFEVFEVTSAVILFWFMTSARRKGRAVKRQKRIFYLSGIAAIFLIGMFVLNIMRRYGDESLLLNHCTQNFCFVPFGFGNFLEYPVYLLTGYFGNGGYFIAALFETTLTHGEAGYLVPMQSVLSNWGSDEFGVRAFMCEQYVACRFVWTPEVASLISIFGIFAIPIVNIIVLYLAKFEEATIRNFSIPGMILVYFAFTFAISLPSANFYTVSSPSILATIFMVVILLGRRYWKMPSNMTGGGWIIPTHHVISVND